LTGALPVALGLVRIDLAHFFEEILRVRPRNIGGSRSIAAIARFRTPRNRLNRLVRALWHGKKLGENARKASQRADSRATLARKSRQCQTHRAMKLLVHVLVAFSLVIFSSSALAQTMSRTPAPSSDSTRLDALIKKLDEQNIKIDMLSQQILKLEQQIANMRPGVMVGEVTPAPTPITATATAPSTSAAANSGNSHMVARGETLTSIAKMHGVSITELQRFNHIENDRKLQIGQTLMIPAPGASPSSSPE
jgi:LysM repeat protein